MPTNEELTGLVARAIALLESLRWRPGDFDPEARLLRDCLAAIGGTKLEPGNRCIDCGAVGHAAHDCPRRLTR